MSALTALYIKRMYADDPCLRNAKIVYSIYNDDFKNPLNKDFATKLKADGAKEADLKLIKADTSFVGLTKLAIDFADGVIQGSETINQEVLDYISRQERYSFPSLSVTGKLIWTSSISSTTWYWILTRNNKCSNEIKLLILGLGLVLAFWPGVMMILVR